MAVTEIKYNGSIIASLLHGQTATLKCKGDHVRMLSDIEVQVAQQSGGGSDANIVPLVVAANGEYGANDALSLTTETWTDTSVFDLVIDYYGTPLPFAKATKLVSNKNAINLLLNPMCSIAMNLDGDENVITFDEIEHREKEWGVELTQYNMPVAVWVKDANAFNSNYGVTWCEENAVYVVDFFTLMGVSGSVSITAFGKSETVADGFLPVTVALPLVDEEQVITPKGGYQYLNDGKYYRNVIVKGVQTEFLTVTPSMSEQKFTPSDNNTFYKSVTVKAADLTKMRVLCDCYIETMPKTEYKVGEWLSTSNGVLMLLFTDGTYTRHAMRNSEITGFITNAETEAKVTDNPGRYSLTVNYTEDGITCRTTYDITVTDENGNLPSNVGLVDVRIEEV